MRPSPGQLAVAAASALVLSIALTGCSTSPGVGSVVVSIAYDETAKAQPVEVTVTDEVGNVMAQETLAPGQTRTFSDIALGPVTIEAVGLCSVGMTLTATTPVATADFGPANCKLS